MSCYAIFGCDNARISKAIKTDLVIVSFLFCIQQEKHNFLSENTSQKLKKSINPSTVQHKYLLLQQIKDGLFFNGLPAPLLTTTNHNLPSYLLGNQNMTKNCPCERSFYIIICNFPVVTENFVEEKQIGRQTVPPMDNFFSWMFYGTFGPSFMCTIRTR